MWRQKYDFQQRLRMKYKGEYINSNKIVYQTLKGQDLQKKIKGDIRYERYNKLIAETLR